MESRTPTSRLTHHVLRFTLLLVQLQFSPPVAAQERVEAIGVTTLVSLASDGTQGNGGSFAAAISAKGRYVAFQSDSTNLVIGDTNNLIDIFVRDRLMGETSRVSVASDGTQSNGYSFFPAISADGRYVAFSSDASTLVNGDTCCADVFLHDRQTDVTTRVSVASDGTQGNHSSGSPAISANGRYVAFNSYASNLVSGDSNYFCDIDFDGQDDNCPDVFVHDRVTGVTSLVSLASDGVQGNHESLGASISADGRYVAFTSQANNLVIGDTCCHDIFAHDRETGETTRVSVAPDGTQANSENYSASISAGGHYVVFESYASNLVRGDTNECDSYSDGHCPDVFVHDRLTGRTTRVSVASDGTQGNSYSFFASIAPHGRLVAFQSRATNLVSGDTNGFDDIFLHDRRTGQTTRVSVASDGEESNLVSYYPALSAGETAVAFESYASNLVSGDTNGTTDVFVHELVGAGP